MPVRPLIPTLCAAFALGVPPAFAQDGGNHKFRIINQSSETLTVSIANQGLSTRVDGNSEGQLYSSWFANPSMWMGSSKAYYVVRVTNAAGAVICQPTLSARVLFAGATECRLDGGSLGTRCSQSGYSPSVNGMCEFALNVR